LARLCQCTRDGGTIQMSLALCKGSYQPCVASWAEASALCIFFDVDFGSSLRRSDSSRPWTHGTACSSLHVGFVVLDSTGAGRFDASVCPCEHYPVQHGCCWAFPLLPLRKDVPAGRRGRRRFLAVPCFLVRSGSRSVGRLGGLRSASGHGWSGSSISACPCHFRDSVIASYTQSVSLVCTWCR
jgi:hypothetical protein